MEEEVMPFVTKELPIVVALQLHANGKCHKTILIRID
jgi:hypothetical protein